MIENVTREKIRVWEEGQNQSWGSCLERTAREVFLQLSRDVQMRRTWWWQVRREGYSICNGIKTNMGEAERKADGIRCENQAGFGTYRALIRSLDFIWVVSGRFKQILCKDITQTYFHFKKFLLHWGEWLQGEQEWKLRAKLGGWTCFQERSVSHTLGSRGSGKKALKWMHVLDTGLRERASGLGLAACDDDGEKRRWRSKRTSRRRVGGGPPSGGACWAGRGQAEAWRNQGFTFHVVVCGMLKCLVIWAIGNGGQGTEVRFGLRVANMDGIWTRGNLWYFISWASLGHQHRASNSNIETLGSRDQALTPWKK